MPICWTLAAYEIRNATPGTAREKPEESPEERDERRRKERLDKERREREGFQFRLDRTWENYETAQTQEERLDALEGICHLLLERARSALAVEIMLKMLGKIRLKRQVADMNAHADDDTYQKMKRLGLFILIHRELDRPYGDRESGLDIPAGTEIVELHLPPPPPEKKRTPLQLVAEARESLRQVARYLALHEDRMQPEFITGITYEAMADAAEKLGFETRKSICRMSCATRSCGSTGNWWPWRPMRASPNRGPWARSSSCSWKQPS